MSKNVLVLTGSPRKSGNSEMLADAFAQGAAGAGHDVMRFPAGRKRISGCRACGMCWSEGRACSVDDDFKELEPMLEKADVIVFVSPLYWFGMSSQIKAAIDRFHAYGSERCARPMPVKETALIMCGETDLMEDFSGAVRTYENMIGYKGWKDAGGLIVPCVGAEGDVRGTGALDGAGDLGRSI